MLQCRRDMKLNLTFITFFSLFLFSCCTPTRYLDYDEVAPINQFTFLNGDAAAKAITNDRAEGFFDKIQVKDMQIQMGNKIFDTPEATKAAYVEHLKSSVLPFTTDEERAIRVVLNRALMLCNSISSEIFPREVKLVKVDMNHYGASVFYSRENTIVIPENVLRRNLDRDFLKAILREVFHIYSRYNYWQRMELYSEIGFEPIFPLHIPSNLKDIMLTNPDGIDNYVIHHLSDKNDTDFTAIPIIRTKESNHYRSLSFYSNLEFSLYKVKQNKIVTNSDGSSTIDMDSIENFYEQIGTNTTYIIHPDEILADNFALLALWRNEYLTTSEMAIDNHGRALLIAIEQQLKTKSN